MAMTRILVTDDEEPVRMIMAEVLRRFGYEVDEARSARAALEQHRKHPADLIITDLVMRDMDGTELLRRVRASSPETRVIGISGDRRGTIYLNMAKLIGADRVLAKPFSPEELLQAVRTALEGGADATSLQPSAAE